MTSGAEFQALFRQGKRIDRPSLILLWRVTDEPRRLGVAVSRQVRGAVHRNRIKRRLREAYRSARDVVTDRVTLVIVGRPRAAKTPFANLVMELRDALSGLPGVRGRE